MYAIEHYPTLPKTVISIGGQSLLCFAPESDVVIDRELQEAIGNYLGDAKYPAGLRQRLYRAAWELSCSAFAGRQTLFELFNARDLTRTRQDFLRGYDFGPMIKAAADFVDIPASVVTDRLSQMEKRNASS
jgi:4-hydroxyphenylacetate 3-monooxygenase